MSIINVLIPYRSTCHIYTLLVAYSVSSLFAFIYSKSHEITELQQLVKKTADRQPTEWRKERGGRKKERKKEASCYEKSLWCFSTTWDETFALSAPGFWRNVEIASLKLLQIFSYSLNAEMFIFSLFKYVSYINDIHKTCMCPRQMYLLQLEIFSH